MRSRHKRRRRTRKRGIVLRGLMVAAAVVGTGGVVAALVLWRKEAALPGPPELLLSYMAHIPEKEYDQMYEMLDLEQSGRISRDDFTRRNEAIYDGIEIQNMETMIQEYDKDRHVVTYQTSFDTAAGPVSFENEAYFTKGQEGYQLVWDDYLIFPDLESGDKVRVSTVSAERGEILDRSGKVLAGQGTASSVGIVPGRLADEETAILAVAELLEMEPEAVKKKLSAKWVKEDSFVPIKTIPKVDDIEYLIPLEPDEEVEQEKERQEQLLDIPGVMISDVEVRSYPFGEAASHLTGYVQNVTAEDLEEHPGEGYTASSVIGRVGMEGLFEKELKGQNGCRIYIADGDGKVKKELAERTVEHGQDIRLTIDAYLQKALYDQFSGDKSCHVAMNPSTGEVLALVSTPSYDSNDFIMGLSGEKWSALNEDENQPLYNRFRQVWCPGSSFKPVTAAVGLECGAVDGSEDYGTEGLSWQKDSSWGSYYVTTLHDYQPVILENALIYSDNIYFAKAALKIGADQMQESLQGLGFGEELPFEIRMQKSSYSNTDQIETEIQLADSGYGQGQILINPLHLACLYTAFGNGGNVVMPRLSWQSEGAVSYWIPQAFSRETADQVLEGLKKVVNDAHGTGYGACLPDRILAGKTGTAEIKASKDDTSGTELGWFVVFSAEKGEERPLLIVSMTEDVKDRGGSGYVVKKDRTVLEDWFSGRI